MQAAAALEQRMQIEARVGQHGLADGEAVERVRVRGRVEIRPEDDRALRCAAEERVPGRKAAREHDPGSDVHDAAGNT